MSDHDGPEFDEFDTDFDAFESPPTNEENGSIWSGSELPPGIPQDPSEDAMYEVGDESGEPFPDPADDLEHVSATADEGGERRSAQLPRPADLVEGPNGQNGHKGYRPWSTGRDGKQHNAFATGKVAAAPTDEFEQMTALAAAAARTRKRSAVGQLVAAMVPLAFQTESKHRQVLQPVIPVLVRGAAGLALIMFDEGVQQLVNLMPTILTQTIAHLGRLAALGKSIDRFVAASALDEFAATAIEQGTQDTPNRRSNPFTLWDDDDEDEYDER